ncbi:MAG: trypsin-like peptidase domain-containing protein [Actinomycetota bacterium]
MTERPEDEQAAEEAADAAGIDVEDLVDEEHEAPVDTPAERAYSIRAAVAGVRSTRRFARMSLAVAAIALLVAAGTVALALTGVIGGGGDGLNTQGIVAQVTPSTVRVRANFRGQQADGSGWVLDAGDGLVVTNFHVVSGSTEFDVIAGGDSSDADLVAAAPCEDLALLKADETEGLETLPLGSGSDLRKGEPVVALGYPANLSLGEDISSTAGVISVVTSSERLPVPDSPTFEDLVQTDAPLNPGNSGGPLVNADGELVGVNTAILTELGGQPIQGQGYAIGVDRVKDVVSELRRGRSAGWFGTGLVVPPRATQRRERLGGILATGAVPGTSGFESRLEGALVTGVDGRRVDSDLQSYCDAVEDVDSGDSVVLQVSPSPGRRPRSATVRFE